MKIVQQAAVFRRASTDAARTLRFDRGNGDSPIPEVPADVPAEAAAEDEMVASANAAEAEPRTMAAKANRPRAEQTSQVRGLCTLRNA